MLVMTNAMNLVAGSAYLRTLRKAQKGLTQEGLAERIGVSGNTIYRIEAGVQEPKTKQIISLLAILQGDARDLSELINNPSATEQDGELKAAQRLQSIAAQATPEQRKTIADQLRQMANDLESDRAS